jgi:hypothetical protein
MAGGLSCPQRFLRLPLPDGRDGWAVQLDVHV